MAKGDPQRDNRHRVTSNGTKIKTQQLYIPDDALRYRARKLQQLVHVLDDQMNHQPDKINIKDYLMALKEYTDLTEMIRKARIADGSKKTHSRMDKAVVETGGTKQDRPDPFGDQESAGVDI